MGNEKNIFSSNCFDLIRYWAALSVMMLHYTRYALTLSTEGLEIMHFLRNVAAFFPGVVILFSMSGYLIAASFERSKNRKEFFVKRVFRMYPELWMCTVVNLGVIVLLVRKQLDKSIIVWLGTQIFGIANTPSCLVKFATGSVNGALWTIFVEIQLYVVLGVIYPKLKKLVNKEWYIFLGVLVAINIFAGYIAEKMGGLPAKLLERVFLPYAIWFFIGVFCYVRREDVLTKLSKFFFPLLVLYIFIRLIPFAIPGYYADIVVGVLCPLITIGGAYKLPAIRFRCDITYGMFLYHWIVLNIIVYFKLMNYLPWIMPLLLYLGVTFLLAWLSWHFIGKKSKKVITKILE